MERVQDPGQSPPWPCLTEKLAFSASDRDSWQFDSTSLLGETAKFLKRGIYVIKEGARPFN